MQGWWYLGVLLITVLGGTLRYFAVDVNSFRYDEAISAILADAPYIDLITGSARDQGNPPLYWIVLRAVSQTFGDSDAVLRAPSVVAGTLTIPLMALLGRRLFTPTTGLVAALLFAINPYSLELSTDARAYALWHFLIVANMYLFVRWLEEPARGLLLLYSVTLAMNVLCHYYGLFIPLVQAFLIFGMRRDRLWPWLLATAGAAIIALFWLPGFVSQVATEGNLARLRTSWFLQFLATPLVFGVGRTLVWRDQSLLVLGAACLLAMLTFGGPALVGLWRLWQERRASAAVFLTAWLTLPVALPLLIALMLSPLYHARAGSIAVPALLLLVAFGLLALPPRPRAVVAVMIGGLSLISTYHYYTQPPQDDWRAASQLVLANVRADEPLLFDPARSIMPFRHYMPDEPPNRLWYGIWRIDPVADRLLGVRYREDTSPHREYAAQVRNQRAPQDYTDEIFEHPTFWLVLHRRGRPFALYEAFGRKHGYAIADAYGFQGVDLYRFEEVSKEQELSGHWHRHSSQTSGSPRGSR